MNHWTFGKLGHRVGKLVLSWKKYKLNEIVELGKGNEWRLHICTWSATILTFRPHEFSSLVEGSRKKIFRAMFMSSNPKKSKEEYSDC